MNSTTKKSLYGFLFFIVIVFIFFGGYSLFFNEKSTSCFNKIKDIGEEKIDCGGACEKCETLEGEMLRVSRSPVIFSSKNQQIIFAEVLNPNTNLDAKSFSYVISLYDLEGRKIEQKEGRGSIGASSRTIILENNIKSFPGNVGKIILDFKDLIWQKSFSVNNHFSLSKGPFFQNENEMLRVSGIIKNETTTFVPSVRIVVIIADKYGKDLFVSNTFLSDFRSLEEREFIVRFPKDESLFSLSDPSKTKVFIEAQ